MHCWLAYDFRTNSNEKVKEHKIKSPFDMYFALHELPVSWRFNAANGAGGGTLSATVRLGHVVVQSPSSNDLAGLLQRVKLIFIQACIKKDAVKAIDMTLPPKTYSIADG